MKRETSDPEPSAPATTKTTKKAGKRQFFGHLPATELLVRQGVAGERRSRFTDRQEEDTFEPTIRRVPEGGALVEVHTDTIQGRSLLRACEKLNERIVGVLAFGQIKVPVSIIAAVVLPDEMRALIHMHETLFMGKFMCFVNSNVATEVKREADWSGHFWGDRYRSTQISDEPEAQEAKLKELLGLPVARGFVEKPEEWPGLECTRALLGSGELKGRWFNRTKEYEARRRGKKLKPDEHVTEHTVELAPLPCWQDLDQEERRGKVKTLRKEIIAEGNKQRRKTGERCVGTPAVKVLDPRAGSPRPKLAARESKRGFFAVNQEVLAKMRTDFALVQLAYDSASRELRGGLGGDVSFPPGCYPPALPYVPYSQARLEEADKRYKRLLAEKYGA